MRLHFLDLERLCFGVIHQTVVLRLVDARRRIVAEGKAAPKLLRHAGDGVLIFVVDGRLACAKHNLGIRAQPGGVYRAAPAIQAEAAGDVYRALQRNLRISILQIQRTIGIIFIRIRLIIGECAVLDDVLAGAKLHGAAKVVRRRYRHMVQTCGVVLAGVLDLAHINAAGHSQIFQHQTIGRIILIPAVATIAKIDASVNGAWMFGAVGDGQFLPCGVRAIELAPSLSGSKLQCQIVTIQAQVAHPIHRKAMAAVISFLDRPCNILGQIQVISGNGICLYGNISQRRIGGIRHADAMNRVKRYLIQLHLCVSVAADCVAQVGVPRQGGKDDIGEARCSIVEFKATPADCEATAGYGDCSRKIRSRCAARAHQHTESFVLLHPGAAGDGQRAAVHADQRLIVIVAAVAVCICRRHCQRAAGNIHCCAADNIPNRPERSDRAALDGDRVGVGALSAAGNAHRFFCLQRAAFQRKVRRGGQLDAAVRQLTAAGEFVLNGQRAAVLHFYLIIIAGTGTKLAKAQRTAVQADRNIAANREVMLHLHRLRQIVASSRQRGVGVLELFVGRTVVLVLTCQFQRKGLGRCVILYCIVRVSGRYGGGQVFRHVFRKHTRRLHDDLHARRCVALFQHSHFGVCAEINGAVCHIHAALCGEAGVLVDNANGVIAGVGLIGAACQNHRTAIQHDNVVFQILCGGNAGNRQLAAVHNDLSFAGGFHVRQVHGACLVQHHAANLIVATYGHSAAVVDQSIFRARAKLRGRVIPGTELKLAVGLDPDHRFRFGRGEGSLAVPIMHTFHAAASCHNGGTVLSGSAAGDLRDLHLAAGYMDGLAVAHGGERAYQPRRTRHVGEHRTCTVVDHGDPLAVHRTAVDDGGRGAVVSYSAEAFILHDIALVMAVPSQRAVVHNGSHSVYHK